MGLEPGGTLPPPPQNRLNNLLGGWSHRNSANLTHSDFAPLCLQNLYLKQVIKKSKSKSEVRMFKGPGPGRPVKYTREFVGPLATQATNFYELAIALGLGWKSTPSTQRGVKAILRKVGVSVPHFVKKKPGPDYPPVPRPVKPPRKKRVTCSREVLAKAVSEGKPVKEIAILIGVEQSTVYTALKRFGLPKPKPVSLPYNASRYVRKYTRDLLEPLVSKCTNFHDLALALGAPGSAYHLKKVCPRLGLDISHFTRKPYAWSGKRVHWKLGKFGRTGKGTWEEVLVLHPVGTDTPGIKLKYALLWSGRTYRCEECNLLPEWNGRELTLQVDHKNGLGWDDRPENLRFLCPNCHSQTDTFCGKNRPLLRAQGLRASRKRVSADRITRARELALLHHGPD